jgi:hypothetical protein
MSDMPLPHFMIDNVFRFRDSRIIAHRVGQKVFQVLGMETIGKDYYNTSKEQFSHKLLVIKI